MTAALAFTPAAKPSPYASVSYRAWRLCEVPPGKPPLFHEIAIPPADTLEDAKAAALTRDCFYHKEHLAIRETGIRLRQWGNGAEEVPFDRVHLYQIKRKSTPRYEGPFGERRVHDLYAELVCVLPGEVWA